MEFASHLADGFRTALFPQNLLYCAIGVIIGMIIGSLPGLGPTASVALLLPVTYSVPPVSALILLAGIYYGAMYGGTITSVLLNIPGEAASVITCIDGYQMARQGRAGPALGIAAFGSFIGGTVGVLGIMLLAAPLTRLALRFGPAEMVALMGTGLTLVGTLSGGSLTKGLIMAVVGLLLGTVGADLIVGQGRFTFGLSYLWDGIGLVPLAMGLFGIGEILSNLGRGVNRQGVLERPKGLLPTGEDWRVSTGPIWRGTLIGFLIGMIPGGAAAIASVTSYAMEKRFSKHPERFGRGAIEGVAGPETANNAATAGCFVPLMTLGLPTNSVMALLLSALIAHGISPGPMLLAKHPDVFWGLIASMYIGNVMLLILNVPLIGVFVSILRTPYSILSPLILLFCVIGAYALNSSAWDILAMAVFGVLGYVFNRLGFDLAPLILGFVLGPIMETSLRQALLMAPDRPLMSLVSSPISVTLYVIAVLNLVLSICRKRKERAVMGGPDLGGGAVEQANR